MKTINELTLYDLGGQDFDVWLTENKKFGFDLQLTDEDGAEYEEKGLHRYAAESLADFCRRYLACYDRVIEKQQQQGA